MTGTPVSRALFHPEGLQRRCPTHWDSVHKLPNPTACLGVHGNKNRNINNAPIPGQRPLLPQPRGASMRHSTSPLSEQHNLLRREGQVAGGWPGPSSSRQLVINTAGGREWRPAPTQRAGNPVQSHLAGGVCCRGERRGGNRGESALAPPWSPGPSSLSQLRPDVKRVTRPSEAQIRNSDNNWCISSSR